MEAMELQKGEEECEAKVRKYDRRLRICEPSSLTPRALQEMREEWHDELFMALSEMIDSIERFGIKHEQELSSHVVAVWKQRITDGQGEFINFLNMVSSKLDPSQDSALRPVNVSMPEDRMLPLRRFLDSLDQQNLSDCLPPPHQGGGAAAHHRPAPGLSLSAPQVPWTPPRKKTPCQRNPQYPIHQILNSPRSSSLLAPLFTNPAFEAMEKGKEECEAKVRKYNRLLRTCEPSAMTPSTLQEARKDDRDKLRSALDEMVDTIEKLSIKHGQELGSQEVAVWKQRITDGEGEYFNYINVVSSKL